MIKLILVGGGGHCESVVDVIKAQGKYEIAGIIDPRSSLPGSLSGHHHFMDESIPEELVKGHEFLITIGNVKNPGPRKRMIDLLNRLGAVAATVVSPYAYVSPSATVSPGTVVHHGAVVNAHAQIAGHAIINTFALVEHGAKIGANVHVSTRAVINGGCEVGDHSMVGSGAVLKQGVRISTAVVVGAQAFVANDLGEAGLYVGIPATLMKGSPS